MPLLAIVAPFPFVEKVELFSEIGVLPLIAFGIIFLSAAKPRPWNCQSCCCGGGDHFLFQFFFRDRDIFIKTLLDNIDVINCANFANCTFDKNSKKRFDNFAFSPVLDNFDLPNDLKINI